MTTATSFTKEIAYDRETRDFRATLDGNYIGHFGSYYEAEVALDQVAYDMLMDGQCATVAELDGGSSPAAACPTCEGEGRIPAGGWGDQAGGYAQTCPDCTEAAHAVLGKSDDRSN
jgi:hypothetical protein